MSEANTPVMRAKMKVLTVESSEHSDRVTFGAVGRNTTYPNDGSDGNNTFAKFTPQAELKMTINNPALFGKLRPGKELYVDFSEVD